MSELQRLNDPNYAIQLAVGPPLPELVAQQPNTGLSVAGRYDHAARRCGVQLLLYIVLWAAG
jgi:hypothetical protein